MPKRFFEPLGQLVKRLRSSRGLTQRDLGLAAGYTNETIARIEQGRGQLSPRSAKAVLQAIAKSGRIRFVEAEDFFVGAGMISGTADTGVPSDLLDWLETHDILSDSPHRDPLPGVPNPRHDAMLEQCRDLVPLLLEAIERSGKSFVASLLNVAAQRPPIDAEIASPTLTHVAPIDSHGLTGTMYSPHRVDSKGRASKPRRAAG